MTIECNSRAFHFSETVDIL